PPLLHGARSSGLSPLSLHDALPILLVVVSGVVILAVVAVRTDRVGEALIGVARKPPSPVAPPDLVGSWHPYGWPPYSSWPTPQLDRKSTRLNSSHVKISYAVFCLQK